MIQFASRMVWIRKTNKILIFEPFWSNNSEPIQARIQRGAKLNKFWKKTKASYLFGKITGECVILMSKLESKLKIVKSVRIFPSQARIFGEGKKKRNVSLAHSQVIQELDGHRIIQLRQKQFINVSKLVQKKKMIR